MAGNPPYVLEQTVIAAGVGQNAAGGTFTLSGTVGRPAAGVRSANAGFAVTGGFWTAEALSPTAAAVSLAGRVLTPDGSGLRNAPVTLTDAQGNSRTVLSRAFGRYRFEEVAAGETVIVSVVSKRYQFSAQVLNVTGAIEDLDFVAEQTKTNADAPF